MPRWPVILAIGAFALIVGLILLITSSTVDRAFGGVVLGAIIAGIVSVCGEGLRIEHESRQDSVRRENDRKIESDRIQRNVLLRLQKNVDAWTAGTGPQVEIAYREAQYRAEEVLDEPLRNELKRVLGEGSDALPGEELVDDLAQLRDHLGTVLRKYLEPPAHS